MRHLLETFLLLGAILATLWTAAYLCNTHSLELLPDKAIKAADPARSAALTASALRFMDASLALSPASASPWYERSKLLELNPLLLSAKRSASVWEEDLMAAIVRSPADVVPLLRLTLTCSSGYLTSAPPGPDPCTTLFEALLVRSPNYAYAHFRYADYLYDQAKRYTSPKEGLAGPICRQYGHAMTSMAKSGLLRGWHEDGAYYNCTDLSNDISEMLYLSPSTPHQWALLSQGLSRKSDDLWQQLWPTLEADLEQRGADRKVYEALAYAMARFGEAGRGAEILWAYASGRPKDSGAWAILLSYLDKNQKIFGPQAMLTALTEAERQSRPEPPSGLYLLSKSCQLKQVALAESFFSKMLSRDAQDPAVYLSMGRCLQHLGRKDQANILIKKAVGLAPGSASLHLELGRSYAALKQYNLAMAELQKALDINPNDKRIKQEMRRLGIYE